MFKWWLSAALLSLCVSALAADPVAQVRRSRVGGVAVTALAFHPKDELLAVGTADGTLILWDLTTESPWRTWRGHTGAVTYAAVSGDGRTLTTANVITFRDDDLRPRTDWKVKTWRVEDQRGLKCVDVQDAYGPDRPSDTKPEEVPSIDIDRVLADCSSGKLTPDEARALFRARGEGHDVTRKSRYFAGDVSADGRTAAHLRDDVLRVWDVPGKKQVAAHKLADAVPMVKDGVLKVTRVTVLLSPDGKRVATNLHGSRTDKIATSESTTLVWDIARGKLIGPVDGFQVYGFVSDVALAVQRLDNMVIVDPETGKVSRAIPRWSPGFSEEAGAFHPNGKWFAGGRADPSGKSPAGMRGTSSVPPLGKNSELVLIRLSKD